MLPDRTEIGGRTTANTPHWMLSGKAGSVPMRGFFYEEFEAKVFVKKPIFSLRNSVSFFKAGP
jgi:hypothetical protein